MYLVFPVKFLFFCIFHCHLSFREVYGVAWKGLDLCIPTCQALSHGPKTWMECCSPCTLWWYPSLWGREVTMFVYLGVSKNSGKTPKMDGENNGNPYEQMDDFRKHPFGLVHLGQGSIVCWAQSGKCFRIFAELCDSVKRGDFQNRFHFSQAAFLRSWLTFLSTLESIPWLFFIMMRLLIQCVLPLLCS